VDRHALLGDGRMTTTSFRRLVNDRQLLGLPMILETPKGKDRKGRDNDKINLGKLRRWIK
jgi:endonuclease IV